MNKNQIDNILHTIVFYTGSFLLLYGLLILFAEVCAEHYPQEVKSFFQKYRFLKKFCPTDQTLENFRIPKVIKYHLIEVLILCELGLLSLSLTPYK